MVKAAILFVCLILCPITTYASEPKWTPNTEFLYGMNVRDFVDDSLPAPPISESYLSDGLTIEIINGMPFQDKFMLVFLLNGYLQPYIVEGEKVEYSTHILGGDSSIKLNVSFDKLFIVDRGIQYLQVMTIGLLDKLPKNASDPVDGFSNTLTIPFQPESPPNTQLHIKAAQIRLPCGVVAGISGDGSTIRFFGGMDENDIFFPPLIQESQLSEFACSIVCAGQSQIMQMIVVADGVPHVNEGMAIPCYQLIDGYAYRFDINLSNLTQGTHQLFAVACPVFESNIFITTTTKLRVDVKVE